MPQHQYGRVTVVVELGYSGPAGSAGTALSAFIAAISAIRIPAADVADGKIGYDRPEIVQASIAPVAPTHAIT